MNAGAVSAAAERLRVAAETGEACAPVRDLIGSSDVAVAYAVQQARTTARIAEGATIVGRKIGLTSSAVQYQLGVDRPDFGVLFADMAYDEDVALPMSRLLQPKVEAEIAFILAEDLIDGPFDPYGVRAAVLHAVAAIEIVDSRIANWDISFGDTVADNASSGLFVLGSDRVRLVDFEPMYAEMVMSIDGELVSAGTGADCLGDPLIALAWLAEAAASLGEPLRAGQVVLSGALGPMVSVLPGAVVTARISGLGSVTARFTEKDDA